MKDVLKSIIFVTIFIILMIIANIIVFPKENIKRFGLKNVYDYDILEEEDDIIDVLVLGDSLVYSSYSPMEVWNNYGITSYDCAEPAQVIQQAYRYIKVAIEKEHPKIVIMEPNVMFRDIKKRKLKNALSTEGHKIPIIKYHDNWKHLFEKKEDIVKNVNKGYNYISKTMPSKPREYMAPSPKQERIPMENYEYLEKIVKLCNDNNAKLVFISFPTQKSWNYKKHNTTNLIAAKYGIEFLDLNLEDIGIDWINDTKDEGAHLNYKGSKKVSLYIGNYLKETGLVEDHRADNRYRLWEKAYKIYEINSAKY